MRKILASGMPALCLVAWLCWVTTGHAHTTRLSSSQLTVAGAEIVGVVEVNGLDMEVALKDKLTAPDGTVPADLAAALQGRVADYLLQHLVVAADGKPCPGQGVGQSLKADHLLVQLRWRCAGASDLAFTATLFHEIDPASRHMLTVKGDAKAFALLGVSNPRSALSGGASKLGEVLWRYLLSGIEHIAIGFDHIAFIVALILWGRRFWPLAGVITAFTIAHSITLSLAVLDVVTLPSRLVESAIALSIVYVAAENFFVRDIGRRWIITFLFGLVHGFGFASVLRDYGIPQDRVGWALAAFNVGVEIGQLAIVAIAFGVMFALGRVWAGASMEGERRRPLVYSVSGVILLLGLYWAAERIFFGS